MIVTVCAWCRFAKWKARLLHVLGFRVSHGICAACKKKFEEDS